MRVVFYGLTIKELVHTRKTATRKAAFNEVPQHSQCNELLIKILVSPTILVYFFDIEPSSSGLE